MTRKFSKKSSLQKHKNKATQRKTKMSETNYDPLYNKRPIISGGSVLKDKLPIISGGAPDKHSNKNIVKDPSKTFGDSNSDYIRLMEALKNAKSFCKKTGLKLTDLNNQEAQDQFILNVHKKCPNLGNKTFTDIVDVMIDVLHKYYMGFNKMFGRESFSGHGESIMITCVKYLFGIVEINTVKSASILYSSEQLTRTQRRVRLLHFYSKGFTKKIMSAAELLTILNIELKKNPVKL